MLTYFKKRRLRYLLEEHPDLRGSRYLSMNNIRSVVLLIEFRDFQMLGPFIESISKKNKTLQVLLINAPNKFQEIPNVRMIRKNEISLWGYPKRALREYLKTLHPDCLITLSLRRKELLLLLATLIRGELKTGIYIDEPHPFNLMIEQTDGKTLDILANELLFYLNKIESNDLNL